jgi:hypothetical protein
MPRRRQPPTPSPDPDPEPSPRPAWIVAYREGQYYLQEEGSGRQIGGPFDTSWAALEHARLLAALRRWQT